MAKKAEAKKVEITAPDIRVREFKIVGTAPYVQNKFSAKAQEQIKEKQEAAWERQQERNRECPPPSIREQYMQAGKEKRGLR